MQLCNFCHFSCKCIKPAWNMAICSWFTLRDDVPLSPVTAEACLISWPSTYSQSGASYCCVASIDGVCMSVCCATLLSNEFVGCACEQAQSSTWEAGHVGLMGRERGKKGYWVTLYPNYLFCLAWSQCFCRRLIQACMVTGCQPLSTPCAVGPGQT